VSPGPGKVYWAFPPGHQPGSLFHPRASSEATSFDNNFRIDFCWHVGDLLTPKSSKSGA
jgi:hypothetical protein